MRWDFTPNCFPKYKIIRVLDHDLSVCITQDDKIKLLRVGARSISPAGDSNRCPWDRVKETKRLMIGCLPATPVADCWAVA
ncbi:MAG: hypothetical protein KAG66_08120, partial [Methylococcales bacterium]|nr:hypothetical protein [Methylococcales bacterium]